MDGGSPLRLYDLFAEHRHNLLLCGNMPEVTSSRLPRYPERYVAVHRIGVPGTAGAELTDRDGEVAARYGSTPAAYLIRPDGYVGFRAARARLQRACLSIWQNYSVQLGRPIAVAQASGGRQRVFLCCERGRNAISGSWATSRRRSFVEPL